MQNRRNRSGMGFTLLEALVVMALLGVLLALAAPGFSGLLHKHQTQAQAEHFMGSLLLARSEALRRQQRVTLCARGAGDVCAGADLWTQGWLVFVDGNHNAALDAQEVVLQVHAHVPAFLRAQGNAMVNRYVSYGPDGRSQTITGAFQAGTFTWCKPGASPVWRVVINAVGKPRLESTSWRSQEDC